MNKYLFVKRRHNLLESNFEDCAMLYDIEAGSYYVLNCVGSQIWGQLQEDAGITVETIIANIQLLYPAIETVESDVMAFVENAQEKGIIVIGECLNESVC